MIVLLAHLPLPTAASNAPLRLWVLPCSSWSGDDSSDGWSLMEQKDGTYVIRNTQQDITLCLDAGPISDDGKVPTPMASPCDGRSSQMWRKNSTGVPNAVQIHSCVDNMDRCLAVASSAYTVGPGLLLANCNPTGSGDWFLGKNSKWYLPNTTHSSIRSHSGGCCGDIFATRPVCLAVDRSPTCFNNTGAWCDLSLEASKRAKALVDEMTLEEKATNMDSHNFG